MARWGEHIHELGVSCGWFRSSSRSEAKPLPISPDQVHAVFGSDVISGLAAKFGLNPQDLAQKLSQVLPQAVDKLTPNGVVKPG